MPAYFCDADDGAVLVLDGIPWEYERGREEEGWVCHINNKFSVDCKQIGTLATAGATPFTELVAVPDHIAILRSDIESPLHL